MHLEIPAFGQQKTPIKSGFMRNISFLCSYYGADGEIRTLAAVAHPTPLAGAPRHQLEYICKTVTITHTVKFNTD